MENLEQIMPSPAKEATLQKVLETLERIEKLIYCAAGGQSRSVASDDQVPLEGKSEED